MRLRFEPVYRVTRIVSKDDDAFTLDISSYDAYDHRDRFVKSVSYTMKGDASYEVWVWCTEQFGNGRVHEFPLADAEALRMMIAEDEFALLKLRWADLFEN